MFVSYEFDSAGLQARDLHGVEGFRTGISGATQNTQQFFPEPYCAWSVAASFETLEHSVIMPRSGRP